MTGARMFVIAGRTSGTPATTAGPAIGWKIFATGGKTWEIVARTGLTDGKTDSTSERISETAAAVRVRTVVHESTPARRKLLATMASATTARGLAEALGRVASIEPEGLDHVAVADLAVDHASK